MKTKIVENIGRSLNRVVFNVRKHSPEILIVTGTLGIITSGVLACKATMKVDDILEKSREDIDKIHKCAEDESLSEEYTPEDAKKDLTIAYVKTGISLAKLYAPSVTLAALSITSIIASNNILRKRNIALIAAYKTVNNSFKKYRSNVIDRFGEKVDKELKYSIKAKQFDETIEKDGKEKTTKKSVDIADINPIDKYSEYARFFDSSCTNWEKEPAYNLSFLRSEQQYANDLLRARGHVFLNEIYDRLGIPRTKAGQIVGWVYDPDNNDNDNYIDFGIYNINIEKNRDFVNGYEATILLDFNVDGPIFDML